MMTLLCNQSLAHATFEVALFQPGGRHRISRGRKTTVNEALHHLAQRATQQIQENVSPAGLVIDRQRFPVPYGTGYGCPALRAIEKRNFKTHASGSLFKPLRTSYL